MVLHEINPGPSVGQAFGKGLENAILPSLQRYNERQENNQIQAQQTSQLRDALTQANHIYSNPNLSPQEKYIGLNKALAAHPEMAKEVSANFQKQQLQQDQQKQQKDALRAIEKYRQLPEGQLEGLESQPGIANQLTKPQQAPGGVTSQAVPYQIAKNIENILSKNPNSSAEDLQVKMTNAGIPPIYTNSFIETRRRDEEGRRQKESDAEKQDYSSFKDNKEYVDKILNGYEAYKRDSTVLNQMQQLVQNGQLPSPILVKTLEKLGIPIGAIENADAEQFDKLSQELVKNIQGTYGSRILQSEVASFMKSIPSLVNSEEGKKRLVQQWKIMNDGKKVYYDSYKDLRKQPKYEKRLPADLHEKVVEIADPKLDQLAKRFNNMNKIPADYVKSAGKALVVDPSGEVGEIDENYLQDAIKDGYEFLE
jgi:hypothetical protein